MTYLLDTSVYSQPLKRAPLESVISAWERVGDLSCRVSVFCEMEVLQGLHMVNSERLFRLYRTALKNRISILPYTREEAEIFAKLQADFIHAGKTRPVADLCIAATALRHNCLVATLNVKDFCDIPGLQIEDWGG